MTTDIAKNWNAIYARVRSALMRRGRSSHEADDLIQEAWVRLASYEKDHAVNRPEAFLMRTALNLSIDAHRVRCARGEEVLVEDVVLLDLTPSMEDVLLAKERTARVSICLSRLSEKTRDIFLSHRLDGMTYQQIAQRHGVSPSTVEKHVARAVAHLMEWMENW
jgi:RNA polymerase sigma-70 factor (ECF subfamily)